MFSKPKNPNPLPLGQRLNRPVHQREVDQVVTLDDGTCIIEKKLLSPEPEPFRDLGDGDCYGIAYLQTRGIELSPVEGASRVSPMEAIDVSNKFIDNLQVPDNEN